MHSEPLLAVHDLRTSLRIDGSTFEVICGVSFDLYPGKTLALVGESGCGKSMTALSLLRIAPSPPVLPPKGKVMFRGKDLMTLSEKEMCRLRGGKIAMIFQDPSNALNPVYTIGEQLIEAAMLHLNLNEEEAFNRSVKALGEVGIAAGASRMSDYPHQMSGGMKQRVMIAMALLCEPDILIADEPTTALDVTIQAQVLELMRDIQKRLKTAILLITHDMGVVAELADDVAVMYAGGIVEQGSAEQVFHAPAHPYTIGLFKSLKREGGKGNLYTIKGSVPSLNHIPSGCPFHPRCHFAFEKCDSGSVPPFEVENPLHTARCWLQEKS
jgi:peptide/nickel transport system ATP-binding protein